MKNGWAKAGQSKQVAVPAELYPTPAEATHALLDTETFPRRVWEPASGLGHISKVLESRGHEVFSSDLHAEKYGFGETANFLESKGSGEADAIVTNPPYSLLRDFMRRAFSHSVSKIAFLTPFDAVRVQKNIEVWREVGFPRVHLLIPTLSIDCGADRGVIKSIFNHAWMVWDRREKLDHPDLRHLFWRDSPSNSKKTEDLL